MTDPLHILAVVDEPLAERLLSRYLQGQGFQVTAVATEEDALEALQASLIDVILFDADITDCDIPQAIKLIKILNFDKGISSIIIMSNDIYSYMSDNTIAECVYAFIAKPVDPRVLVETIDTLGDNIRKAHSSKSAGN